MIFSNLLMREDGSETTEMAGPELHLFISDVSKLVELDDSFQKYWKKMSFHFVLGIM